MKVRAHSGIAHGNVEMTVKMKPRGGAAAGEVVNEQPLSLETVKVSNRIFEVPIVKVHLGKNYRKSFRKADLEELAESIRHRGGLIKPIWVEKKGDHYELLAGQRRYLAHLMGGIERIRVRIFSNINDRQRILLQMSENIQESTPPYDAAEFYWDLYKVELSSHVGVSLASIDRFRSYRDIPSFLRKKYPLARFSDEYRKSEAMMADAFRFQLLHESIKKLIAAGKVSYSVGTQIARIQSRNEQYWLLTNLKERSPTEGHVRKKVNEYLRRSKEKGFQLEPIAQKEENGQQKEFCSFLDGAVTIFNGFSQICETRFPHDENLGRIMVMLSESQKELSALEDAINRHTDLLQKIRNMKHRHREGLKERILSDKVKLDRQQEPIQPNLIKSKRVIRVPFDNISRDKKQIRRTYSEQKLRLLAENMRHTNKQLEPVLLKRVDGEKGRYKLVDGERRYRAVRLNGWKHLDADIEVLDDKQCRIIQGEANLQAPVSPAERAEALHHAFQLEKQLHRIGGTELSFSGFLEIMDEGGAKVKNALLFHNLSERVKSLVREGALRYGVAIALACLKDEDEQYGLAIEASVHNHPAEKIREIVRVRRTNRERYPTEQYSEEVRGFWTQIENMEKDAAVRNVTESIVSTIAGIRSTIRMQLRQIQDDENERKRFLSNETMVEKFDALTKSVTTLERTMSGVWNRHKVGEIHMEVREVKA